MGKRLIVIKQWVKDDTADSYDEKMAAAQEMEDVIAIENIEVLIWGERIELEEYELDGSLTRLSVTFKDSVDGSMYEFKISEMDLKVYLNEYSDTNPYLLMEFMGVTFGFSRYHVLRLSGIITRMRSEICEVNDENEEEM